MNVEQKTQDVAVTKPTCKNCGRINPYMPDRKKSLCKSCLRRPPKKK